MSTSDIIEIISIIVSAFTSSVAICISVIAFKQSERILEETTRPYITIYSDTITVCEQSSYFVIKNFGHSSAVITDFRYDPILKQTHQLSNLFCNQFDSIAGIVLAPGQSKLLPYKISALPIDVLTFSLSYQSNVKKYNETVTMNVKNFNHLPVTRPQSKPPKTEERLVQSLQELIERSI